MSDRSSVILFMFAVCWKLAQGKVQKKSKTATVITPKKSEGIEGWLEENGIKKEENNVILFKRVSSDLKTQENTPNETVWTISSTLTHSDWSPKKDECGEGKYHACSRPYFCDEFRSTQGDVYVAISIDVKDLYVWPDARYPHKVAFRKGTVLYRCNKMGKEIK